MHVAKLQYPTSGDRRARSAAYDIPISTESFYSTGGNGNPQLVPLQLSKSENNDYCLPLSTRVELYSTGPSQGYARQTTVSTEYKKTRVGTMIPIKTTQRDEVSQFIQISENTLTPDERDIASTSTSFSEGSGDSPGKPFKLKSLAYDASGRVIAERLSWTDEAQYSDGKLTVTRLDPLGNATTSEHDVRKANGPVIRTILPLGETEVFEFDKLGRQTSQTDALRHQTTTVHVVGPNGTSVQTTSPLGFSHTTTTDVLGREVQTSDNGDETSGKPAARVLSASVYDYQSRLVERVDDLGLRTKYKYDDLNRPTEITDPNGNVVKYTYQKGGLDVEQTLNGDRRSLIHLDGRSKPITTIRYPDSGAIATEHAIAEEHKYDGRGNIIAKAWSQLHNAGKAQALKKEATEFGVDNAITSQTTTGYTDAGSDAVQRRFTHDLFDNVYTYIKETWYADGRHLAHPGPIDIYDVTNKLVISRNQKRQEERREYDQNLRLSQLVRLDGSKVQYTYDGAGKLKTTTYPVSGTSERSYDADGRQVSISQGSQSIKYAYSLDGVEIGVQYTDGRSQTRILDKHSRTVAEKDFNGNVTKTTFHELGQVARRSCEGDTIEYSYGTTNHTKMQLLGTQQNGQGSQQTTYLYDGHGHVRRTVVKGTHTNKIWMDTTQMYDSLGRVQKTVTASDLAPEVRGERVLEYDGVGQLIKDTRSGESSSSSSEVTRYRYDGNSNVVAIEINGKTSTMSFNSIDQRTDAGCEYDANGRLVRDNEGCKYEFDDRDRLISVTQKRNMDQDPTAASQVSTYSYSPDDYLSGYKDETQAVGMYFDGGRKWLGQRGGEATGAEEKEDASIFFDSSSGTPLCTVTKKKSGGGNAETRYLLNQLGSSVAISPTHSSEGKPSYVAKSYDAYGAPRSVSTSSPSSEGPGGASALLGFTSEFTSPTTSIVYLRARHYNPLLRSFLTMDPRRSLSTPASSGDPVNRIDPTGRSWSWLSDHPHLTMAIGVGVALAVTVLGGLVVEAAVGALAALLPATVPTAVVTFASQFIVGAVSGAAGGLAGSIATGDLDSYTWGTAGLDALGSGLGSMATTFVQPHFRTLFNSKGKGVGALVNQGTKKGIPAAEKGLGSVGFGVVIGLEVAKVWADQVTMMDQKGNGSKVAYRGGNTKYEKCGLAYGG
uniref:Teneurin-like YD-shell domain-containing protein n=1 Tax=Bionectria ochroleuca TaxID=29856 RepID=A0A8H7K7Y8_BIOOC